MGDVAVSGHWRQVVTKSVSSALVGLASDPPDSMRGARIGLICSSVPSRIGWE
jgi:hypothetical protein